MNHTLVLGQDFQPIQTISWKRAMCLVFKEKAEVVKYSTRKIKTPNSIYKVPVIIRIIYMARKIYKKSVPLSKKNILVRDKKTCQYCGKKNSGQMTIDHIVPISRGGKNEWNNLVACCYDCNTYKNDRLPSEAEMKLINIPKQPTIAEFLITKLKLEGLDQVLEEFLKETLEYSAN